MVQREAREVGEGEGQQEQELDVTLNEFYITLCYPHNTDYDGSDIVVAA